MKTNITILALFLFAGASEQKQYSSQYKNLHSYGQNQKTLIELDSNENEGQWLKKRLLQIKQQEEQKSVQKKWDSESIKFMNAKDLTDSEKTAVEGVYMDDEQKEINFGELKRKEIQQHLQKQQVSQKKEKVTFSIAKDRLEEIEKIRLNTNLENGEVKRQSESFGKILSHNEVDEQLKIQMAQKEKELRQVKEDKEAAEKKVNEMMMQQKAEQERQLNNRIAEMNHQWSQFCKTADLNSWQSAQDMWAQLESEGHHTGLLQVNTKDIFKSAFKFSQTAQNDFASQQLSDLENAQQNLNNNPNNRILLNEFIAQFKETSQNLKLKYGEFWNSPQ